MRPKPMPGDSGSREFEALLEGRRKAAEGLASDLLTEVPLLYGTPGTLEPHGDPGIVIAQAHQKELVRRNGGGTYSSKRSRSDVALPFERTVTCLAVLFLLLAFFAN